MHGHCDDQFAALHQEFERNFTERGDVGASFAATVEGEFVVDLWAGKRTEIGELPWEEDTIVCVFSVTKTMTALCALVLADRGELNFNDRVSKFWPKYRRNGKETTEIRHVMGHTAGVPAFGTRLTLPELYDWEHVIQILERQAPNAQPGKVCEYHPLTQGFIVGEIVRRISGKSLGEFFHDNIADPLGVDFYIGLAPAHFHRTGEILASTPLPEKLARYMQDRQRTFPSVRPPVTNSREFRRAEIPSVNGHGNAHSIVRVQTVVANGGSAFGINLISPATVEQIFQTQGVIKGMNTRHGIGFGLDGPFSNMMPNGVRNSFWVGGGGSFVLSDHTNRICMAYAMNQMYFDFFTDGRSTSLVRTFYEGLQSRA